MRAFARQLRWEIVRLARRPRSLLGFGVVAVLQAVMVALHRLPAVREQVLRSVWRVELPADLVAAAFSGVATAVEVLGESVVYGGVIFLALVGGDVVAREVEDGTLRMVLCRPVSRVSVLAQKTIACLLYTAALVAFMSVLALGLGLAVGGGGPMVILVPRDGLVGMLDFETALTRYALAVPIHAATMATVTLLALALSCLPMTPAAATTLTLGVLFADWMVHLNPVFASVAPYTLTMRLGTWRQVFNETIPWLRIERNLTQLAWLDTGLLAVAAMAWRRRDVSRKQ